MPYRVRHKYLNDFQSLSWAQIWSDTKFYLIIISFLRSKLHMIIKKYCQIKLEFRRSCETQKCNLIWHYCSKLVPLQKAWSCYDQNFHICILFWFLPFYLIIPNLAFETEIIFLQTVWKYFYGNPDKILNSFKAAINIKSRVPNAHILKLKIKRKYQLQWSRKNLAIKKMTLLCLCYKCVLKNENFDKT